MFSSILLILLSFVFAFYLYVKWCYSYWANHGVPFIEPKFPFGSLKGSGQRALSLQLANIYDETKKSNSPICGLYLFFRPAVLVTDLKFMQRVLIKDFQHFEDRGLYYNRKAEPLAMHLVNLESVEWKSRRANLSPTFTSGRMKCMFPTVVSVGQEFVTCVSKELKNGNEIEIRDWLARFATDVIGNCAFGIECNSLKDPNTQFRQMGKIVFDQPRMSRLTRFFMASNKKLANFLGIRLHDPDTTEFFLNVVKQTVDYREKNDVHREDFMDLLIQLKNKGHLKGKANTGLGQLTILEIAAEAFVFFLAGFETTSNALTFALYELAQPHNKHIQTKAREEIDNVLAKYDGELTYEALNEMHYIEQIVNESLRKYPPTAILFRIVTEDYECTETKTVLRKGTSVLIPVYGIHHDPDIYEQPEEFRPERFSAEEIKKRPNLSFLPFGDGPRMCIGMRFAMMQTRIGLVMLLKHFQFSTCDRTPPLPIPFNLIKDGLSPADGVWLSILTISNRGEESLDSV